MKARRFFQPIIDNLNQLQVNGLCVNGSNLNFSFSTMVADNLAAHMIGGFQSSFSTGYFCRRCLINYNDRSLPILLNNVNTRTTIDHDMFVKEVIRQPDKSPLMGVTSPSILQDLIGFHPVMSLPGDVMHDFIEGVCPMIIMAMLKQASTMRLTTYGEIEYFYMLNRMRTLIKIVPRLYANTLKLV